MKLHHLHVAQREARIQRHRQTVAAFFATRRVVLVHRGAAARGEQHGLCLNKDETTRTQIDHQHASQRITRTRLDQCDGAMLFHALDFSSPHLLCQPIDDLDAGLIAFVNRAVKRLAGKCFLMHGTVGIAIKKAAEFIFKFVNALDRFRDQCPRQILIGQPLTALDRVLKMPLD